jgi:hypothetical protein
VAEVRARSPLLAAAICTTVSFCVSSPRYEACYDAFKSEVSSTLFSVHNNVDDVRALCIAAFWLDDHAATFSGLGELGHHDSKSRLHRCISKMLPTKIDCYDRTRLFYLVCLCDHHCSLKYGRPPMTQDWRSLKSPKLFYLSEFSSPRDLGLVSLLKLWTIT